MQNEINNLLSEFVLSTSTKVNSYVEIYISRIEDKYSISNVELRQLWKETIDNPQKDAPSKPKFITIIQENVKIPEIQHKTDCQYIFVKGANSGTICGKSVQAGSNFCSKHSKSASEPTSASMDETKKVPSTSSVNYTKMTVPELKDLAKSRSIPFSSKIKKDELIALLSVGETVKTPVTPSSVIDDHKKLKLNKTINKFWNEKSRFVFDSDENRVVIGRFDGKDIQPLSDSDFEECKKYMYKVKPKLPVPVSETDDVSMKAVRKITSTESKAETIKKTVANLLISQTEAKDVTDVLKNLGKSKVVVDVEEDNIYDDDEINPEIPDHEDEEIKDDEEEEDEDGIIDDEDVESDILESEHEYDNDIGNDFE